MHRRYDIPIARGVSPGIARRGQIKFRGDALDQRTNICRGIEHPIFKKADELFSNSNLQIWDRDPLKTRIGSLYLTPSPHRFFVSRAGWLRSLKKWLSSLSTCDRCIYWCWNQGCVREGKELETAVIYDQSDGTHPSVWKSIYYRFHIHFPSPRGEFYSVTL